MAKRKIKNIKIRGITKRVVSDIVKANTEQELSGGFKYKIRHIPDAFSVKSNLYRLRVIDRGEEVFTAVIKKPKKDPEVSRPHAVNDTHREDFGVEASWFKYYGKDLVPNFYHFDPQRNIFIMEGFDMSLSEYLQKVWQESFRDEKDLEKRQRIRDLVKDRVRQCVHIAIECDLKATLGYKKDKEKIGEFLHQPETSYIDRLNYYLRKLSEHCFAGDSNEVWRWFSDAVVSCRDDIDQVARYIANGQDQVIHGDTWSRNFLIKLERQLDQRLLIDTPVIKDRITDLSKVRLGPVTKDIVEPMMDFSFMGLYGLTHQDIREFYYGCLDYAQSLWTNNKLGNVSSNPEFDLAHAGFFNLTRGIGMALMLEHEQPRIYERLVRRSPRSHGGLHIMDNRYFVRDRAITLLEHLSFYSREHDYFRYLKDPISSLLSKNVAVLEKIVKAEETGSGSGA